MEFIYIQENFTSSVSSSLSLGPVNVHCVTYVHKVANLEDYVSLEKSDIQAWKATCETSVYMFM